jgi:multidrug resistance protein
MSWINKISSSPVILLVCSYALFVEEVIYGMVAPLTPESPAQIKDEHTISMLYGTYAFGLILATPILGIITDRIGRRQPMVIGAICLLVSSICFCIGTNSTLFFAGRVFEGIGAACSWTAGMALVAEFHLKDRVKAMGFAMLGATIGTILGPAVGGEIGDLFGYRMPYYIAIALLAVNLFLVIFWIPKSKDLLPNSSWNQTFRELWGIVTDKSVVTAAFAVALASAGWSLMEPLFPMHAIRIAQASAATIGMVFTASNLLYAFLAPMVSFVSDRFGIRQTAALGLVLTAIFMPLLALSPTLFQAGAVLCLLSVSYAFTINPTSAELGNAVDRRGSKSYAVAYAVYNLAYSVGMIFVDFYLEFVTDEAHKLELLHILLLMSFLFLLCVPIFLKHKHGHHSSAAPSPDGKSDQSASASASSSNTTATITSSRSDNTSSDQSSADESKSGSRKE